MPNRPSFALTVSDLTKSLEFLVQVLGFELVDHRPYSDLAYVLDVDKDLTFVAGPSVENVADYLDPPRFIFKPGDTISFMETEPESRQAALQAKGVTGVRLVPGFLGDQKLTVPGPDAYTFAFIKRNQHPPAEVLAAYEKGVAELDVVLAGLTTSDLALARAPGQWPIRFIVHHLAESESLFIGQFKTALAQSGATYIRTTYNQETWPITLTYAERSIEPSVALIKASRGHILQLLHSIPDYWERYVLVNSADSEGHLGDARKSTVGHLLEVMASHLLEHCEEIREIRQLNGRPLS
ncbi:MAG: DinB family protein [Chloroflexota bacterium]|nr:DinB family protein [Chloroflexota bacterium]